MNNSDSIVRTVYKPPLLKIEKNFKSFYYHRLIDINFDN